jgi:hypothetical protein
MSASKRVALVSLLSLVACTSAPGLRTFDRDDEQREQDGNEPAGTLGGSSDAPQEATGRGCAKMDILFVLDESGSMIEEYNALLGSFPKFIETIEGFRSPAGAQLDYRIAVTNTSRQLTLDTEVAANGTTFDGDEYIGENGGYFRDPKCGMTRPWIARGDADVTSSFACISKLAVEAYTTSNPIEMPLDVMKLAFSDRVGDGKNQGFLRDDALLTVVMLTDEDDQSLKGHRYGSLSVFKAENFQPVSNYVTFLDGLKKGRGGWATAVIAGDRACQSPYGSAVEAPRLKSFVEQAGKSGKFSSICNGDLDVSLKEALDAFQLACKDFPVVVK